MHLYWTGPAVALTRKGSVDLTWLLDAVRDGAVLAAGYGERGNDLGMDDSVTTAVLPVETPQQAAVAAPPGYHLRGEMLSGALLAGRAQGAVLSKLERLAGALRTGSKSVGE
jgi:hypothetical protein